MLRPHSSWLTGGIVAVALCWDSVACPQSYEPDHVLVKFDAEATASCRDSSIMLITGTVMDSVPSIGVYVVQLPDTSVWASIAVLTNRPCIEYAQPNYTDGAVLFDAPNDSLFYRQWHLSNTGPPYGGTPGADIGALAGWAYVHASPDVLVAIMDTGIDITRPDLASDIFTNTAELTGTTSEDLDGNGYPHDIHGWDFYNNDYIAEDVYPHGTAVASLYGAEGNNELVISGVTWSSRILPIKIIHNLGLVPRATLAKAFAYAVDMGARIINCSWVTTRDTVLAEAIRHVRDHGALLVGGAGNDGYDNALYPTQYWPANAAYSDPSLDNVMAVAFTDAVDSVNVSYSCYAPGSFVRRSNYGATAVHIAAPGCDICADYPAGPSCGHTGTSLAAPVVSGAAALLWQQNPTWTYSQIKNRLMVTVDTLPSAEHRIISKGRVDIGRALDNVAPSAISDLAVTGIGHYTQAISWTDTGDDTTCGQASRYHFRYRSGGAITTESQFANASTVPLYLGPPSPSGTFHCVVVDGLTSCTTYGWALKLEDPDFNIGGLSNSASATTQCSAPPYALAVCDDWLVACSGDGGEDGGDESLILVPSATPNSTVAQGVGAVLSGSSPDVSWRSENGVVIGVEGPVTDLLAMRAIRPTEGGMYRIRLAAASDWPISLSDVSLAVVDHARGSAVLATPSGVYSGTPGNITSASVGGASRTSLYQSGVGAVSNSGETIDLALSGGEGRTLLVLELAARAATAELSAGTVDVQTENDDHEWTTVASIAPRRGLDSVAVDVTGASGVRLQVGRCVFIRSITTLTGANEAKPKWLDLSSIRVSGEGVAEAENVTLAPAEHAVLTFAGASQEAETQRSVFLRVTSQSVASAMYSKESQTASFAPELALGLTMRPNPAVGSVTVDYTMARDMNIRIRMYDAAGRLVRTLANGPQSVGSHSLVWDARDDAGAIVRGGLYFCKMEVGAWASTKKVVVLAQR